MPLSDGKSFPMKEFGSGCLLVLYFEVLSKMSMENRGVPRLKRIVRDYSKNQHLFAA